MMKKSYGMRKSFSTYLVVLTTLTLTLGGCSSKKAGDEAADSADATGGASSENSASENAGGAAADDLSEITIGIPQDIDSMDPHIAKSAGT